MKLHEAIEKLLRLIDRHMTTTEIANELNKNGWYQKRDGSPITAFQIHGRVKNYSHLFNRDGTTISLKGYRNIDNAVPNKKSEKPKSYLSEISDNIDMVGSALMNNKNFKSADDIDDFIPNKQGIYCIRINDTNALPSPFKEIIKKRNHNIIYIGVASQSLKKRLLDQELRAKGHGTFFRSIGAVLGYRPPEGSLKGRANKKNYTFSSSDEDKIIIWINKNLLVNWIECSGKIEDLETNLIRKYKPLLNLAKNPMALDELSELRAECVRIANC